MSESMDIDRVLILAIAVLVIGMAIGSNLPGLSIHGPPEPYSTNVKVFFSSHSNCSKEVIRLIDGANSTIYVAMYSFTSQDIAHALIRASSRNVKIGIIGEPTQKMADSMYSSVQTNSTIQVVFDAGSGIMHNKFMVVDGVYVTTGSFNWTNAAENDNAENMLSITDRNIAVLYKVEWDWLISNRI